MNKGIVIRLLELKDCQNVPHLAQLGFYLLTACNFLKTQIDTTGQTDASQNQQNQRVFSELLFVASKFQDFDENCGEKALRKHCPPLLVRGLIPFPIDHICSSRRTEMRKRIQIYLNTLAPFCRGFRLHLHSELQFKHHFHIPSCLLDNLPMNTASLSVFLCHLLLPFYQHPKRIQVS